MKGGSDKPNKSHEKTMYLLSRDFKCTFILIFSTFILLNTAGTYKTSHIVKRTRKTAYNRPKCVERDLGHESVNVSMPHYKC